MQRRFILLVLFIWAFLFKIQAQSPYHIELSDSSNISILTCAPGNQLYSGFGHSAIAVIDIKKRRAMVFNYGTFSFSTPNFYLKFASGKLNYKLSLSSYNRFLESYEHEGRQVIEDRLNLNHQQKQRLFNALMGNYRPENREYLYDFFFDNCATRIIQKIEEVLGDSLQYMPTEKHNNKTFRNLLDEYLAQGSWSDVGIDLVLGSVIDQEASDKEKAFLPDYLHYYLQNCQVNGELLVPKSRILRPDNTNFKTPLFVLTPPFIFWMLFVVTLVFSILLRARNWVLADRIIFSTIGLFGVIVLLMWFATDHAAAAVNLNFFWANPLYLIFAYFIKGTKSKIIYWGIPIFGVINVLVLLLWKIIPQQFNIYFIPIIGIALTRLVAMYFAYRKIK